MSQNWQTEINIYLQYTYETWRHCTLKQISSLRLLKVTIKCSFFDVLSFFYPKLIESKRFSSRKYREGKGYYLKPSTT